VLDKIDVKVVLLSAYNNTRSLQARHMTKPRHVFFANGHMEGMKLIQGNSLLKGSCRKGGVVTALLQVQSLG
jgi:hypothetical protein